MLPVRWSLPGYLFSNQPTPQHHGEPYATLVVALSGAAPHQHLPPSYLRWTSLVPPSSAVHQTAHVGRLLMLALVAAGHPPPRPPCTREMLRVGVPVVFRPE